MQSQIHEVHVWLLGSPIWTSLILSILGSAIFAVIVYCISKYKIVVAFLMIPGQKLGVRWRKARLAAQLGDLRDLTLAHDNFFIAMHMVMSWIVLILICVAAVGTAILGRMLRPSMPDLGPSAFDRIGSAIALSMVQNRAAQVLFPMVALLIIGACSVRLLRLTSALSRYEATRYRLSKKVLSLGGTDVDIQDAVARVRIPSGVMNLGHSQTEEDTDADAEMISKDGFLRVGQLVRHPKYGEGEIVRREGIGDQSKLTVNFRQYGNKKVVQKFARLEPL